MMPETSCTFESSSFCRRMYPRAQARNATVNQMKAIPAKGIR